VISLQERVYSSPKPDGWRLHKLHRVFRVRKGFKNTGMQEDNLLSLSYGRIVRKSIDAAEGLLPESFETYQIVEPGNIVMRLTDLQNDKRSLRQGLVNERGIITSAYDALELEKGHDPRFWAYVLLALDLAKYYYSLGGGVRQSIKFSDFPNDWIAAPNTDHQTAIADFLDHETHRIDQLIAKKERLVELLREKFIEEKRALFYGRVERADISTRFHFLKFVKPHWIISKNARHFKIRMGETILSDAVSDSGRFPVYSATEKDVIFGYVDSMTAPLKRGDIVVPARGNSIGHVKLVLLPSTSTQTTIQMSSIDHRFESKFSFYWMKAFKQYLFPFDRTAIPQITTEQVARNPIPIANKNEQRDISLAFELLEEKENRLLDPTILSVDRLREFRSALITAAVTGQIDVATWCKQGRAEHCFDRLQEDLPLREARA
jgi:type I restriction enzyme, S subunit